MKHGVTLVQLLDTPRRNNVNGLFTDKSSANENTAKIPRMFITTFYLLIVLEYLVRDLAVEDLIVVPQVFRRRRFLKRFSFQQRHVGSSRFTTVGKRFSVLSTIILLTYYTQLCTAHWWLQPFNMNIEKLLHLSMNITREIVAWFQLTSQKTARGGASFYARNIWTGCTTFI